MRKRILVVEDHPSIVKLTCDVLRQSGYEVAALCDPDHLFRYVEQSPPDLILMDVNLPGSDGLALTRALRARPDTPRPVILAFTAMARQEDQDRALAAGCDGYISKPIQIPGFLKQVELHLAVARPAAPGGGTVLVADDSPSMLKLMSALLAAEGFEVMTASNGWEALEQVACNLPDLVITDVSMPQLTGFELCRRLKKDPRTRLIPIVMLTASDDSGKKVEGIECGADDFIEKPFKQVELLTRVRSLIRRAEAASGWWDRDLVGGLLADEGESER